MEYMKAIVLTAPGETKLVSDVPIPTIGDYEALVRIRACGFCNGTDMQLINGTIPEDEVKLVYPTVLGHEASGEVVELGRKVRHIALGDRYIHPNQHFDVGNGYHKNFGGFAQYGYVVDHQAMLEDGFSRFDLPDRHYFAKIPRDYDFIDAGVLLCMNESFSAVRNFGVTKDTKALVYGCGPMGLALMAYMRAEGVGHITAVDRLDERLCEAERIAHPDRLVNNGVQDLDEVFACEKRFDLAVDAVGSASVLIEASHRVRYGGKVGSWGVLKASEACLNLAKLKNNTMLHMLNFSYGQYSITDENVRLVQSGVINPKDFYSHVLPMERFDEARELVRTKTAKKVVITID